jgi:uncharacterized protein
MSIEKKIVSCPVCGQDSIYAPSNPYRPFCREKCKLMDLGAWANEDFRFSQGPTEGDDRHEPLDQMLNGFSGQTI